MTEEFSQEPIEGEEAAKHREMRHEWRTFKEDERPALARIVWAVKNWKFLAFMVIIGAAGQFNSILETAKEWLK